MSVATNSFEEPRLNMGRESAPVYRAMVALEGAIELDPTIRELVKLRASILNAWGARTRSSCCGEFVFVDQAAE